MVIEKTYTVYCDWCKAELHTFNENTSMEDVLSTIRLGHEVYENYHFCNTECANAAEEDWAPDETKEQPKSV